MTELPCVICNTFHVEQEPCADDKKIDLNLLSETITTKLITELKKLDIGHHQGKKIDISLMLRKDISRTGFDEFWTSVIFTNRKVTLLDKSENNKIKEETIEIILKRQDRLIEALDYAKTRLTLKQDEFALGVIDEMMNLENNTKGMKNG